MRRLFRWSFNIAAAVSALLVIVTCVLWVRWTRGYFLDEHRWNTRFGEIGCASESASLRAWRYDIYPDANGLYHLTSEWNPPRITYCNILGLRIEANDPATDEGRVLQEVSAPDWLMVSIFLFLPASRIGLYLRQIRRKNRLTTGLCAPCGYDLRATPGRCPECGATPTQETSDIAKDRNLGDWHSSRRDVLAK